MAGKGEGNMTAKKPASAIRSKQAEQSERIEAAFSNRVGHAGDAGLLQQTGERTTAYRSVSASLIPSPISTTPISRSVQCPKRANPRRTCRWLRTRLSPQNQMPVASDM